MIDSYSDNITAVICARKDQINSGIFRNRKDSYMLAYGTHQSSISEQKPVPVYQSQVPRGMLKFRRDGVLYHVGVNYVLVSWS